MRQGKQAIIEELERRGFKTSEHESRKSIIEELSRRGVDVSMDKEPIHSSKTEIEEDSLRPFKRGARSVGAGLTSIADIPNLPAVLLHAAGKKEKPYFYKPIREKFLNLVDEKTKGELKPRGKSEEYTDEIIEGIAPMIMAPFTGGASLTSVAARNAARHAPKIAKGLSKVSQFGSRANELSLSNVLGTAGASAGSKAFRESFDNPGSSITAGLAGGLLGGYAGRSARALVNPRDVLAKAAGKATLFSPEKFRKQKELGTPYSLSSTSKSEIPAGFEMLMSKLPGSSGVLKKHHAKTAGAFSKNLGLRDTDVSDIDKTLARHGAKKFHEEKTNQYRDLKAKFKPFEDAFIEKKGRIDVSDIIDELEKKQSLATSAASKADFLKTQDGELLTKLKAYSNSEPLKKEKVFFAGKKIELPDGALDQRDKGIGLHDLNQLRKEALKDSERLKSPLGKRTDESREAYKRYGLLAEKRYGWLEKSAPQEVAQASQEARKLWREYKDSEHGLARYVASITKESDDAAAFKKLTRSDPRYLKVVREGLDAKSRADLAESLIKSMGKKGDSFSFEKFHSKFNDLEPSVRKEFLETLPYGINKQKFLSTMKYIVDNKDLLEKYYNSSKTTTQSNLSKIGGKALGSAGLLATGKVLAGVKGAVGLAGAGAGLNLGAQLWVSPKFINRVDKVIRADSMKEKDKAIRTLIKTTTRHHESSRWAEGENEPERQFSDLHLGTVRPHHKH
jgi:hypothetical protein